MGLKFHTYICGSIRDERNAQKLCLESLAQEIIFELNKNPLSLNEIISRYGLKSSSIVKELLSANVLKIKDDKIYVNFCLFTLNDLKKLRIIGEHYGEALAEKVLESSDKIDSVIKEIKYLDYISMDKARFIIVGCYILDLRSLKFFREKGIGSCEVEKYLGGKYILYGMEALSRDVLASIIKGLYWGCHSTESNKFFIASFGDHFGKRYAFPDEYWSNPQKYGGKIASWKIFLNSILHRYAVISRIFFDTIGSFLKTIVENNGISLEELRDKFKVNEKTFDNIIQVLSDLEYIELWKGKVVLKAPYLTSSDWKVVDKVEYIVRNMLEEFISENLNSLREELKRLTPSKWDIGFEEIFIEAWHWIFGYANRVLALKSYFYKPISRRKNEGEYIYWIHEKP